MIGHCAEEFQVIFTYFLAFSYIDFLKTNKHVILTKNYRYSHKLKRGKLGKRKKKSKTRVNRPGFKFHSAV